ncbi:MarR family transcriptional regulator [Methanofollis fontis]|uniref:MarR family transcriptional regulator n=1 Tax=Methanofollis fontis TaxID=2052832 RepID=UPI00102EEADB|nr:MarR family transcriptional regulator [Methanofollis fontis]
MKAEEFDWMVYHAIAWNQATTLPALIEYAGGDGDAVEASVRRLISYLLIDRQGERLRALSVGESILRCQVRHGNGIPLEIENGVIKIPSTEQGREER